MPLFLKRSRHLCSASYASLSVTRFPQSQFPAGGLLACAQLQNTLMRRMPSWGRHYCEHL